MTLTLSNKTSERIPQIFALLNKSPIFGDKEISALCNSDFCTRQFHCRQGVAILKDIPITASDSEVKSFCYDSTQKARFYVHPIILKGRRFLITNYWYRVDRLNVKDNLSLFEKWADSYLK